MLCEFATVQQDDGYLSTCRRCGRSLKSPLSTLGNVQRECASQANVDGLAGNELQAIILSLGIEPAKTCECESWRRKMNAWGTAGCQVHRAEIVNHLRKAYKEMSRVDWWTAVGASLLSGLAFQIGTRDPAEALLDLAIERATSAT